MDYLTPYQDTQQHEADDAPPSCGDEAQCPDMPEGVNVPEETEIPYEQDTQKKGNMPEEKPPMSIQEISIPDEAKEFFGGRLLPDFFGATTEETLLRYAAYMESQEILKINFKMSNAEGDLWIMDGEVKIMLQNKELNGVKYNTFYRASKLKESYNVKVIKIDPEKKTVFVSHFAIKENAQKEVVEKLDSLLAKDTACIVPARVVQVYPNIIVLNIAGLNIPGFLPIKEWSPAYVFDLNEFVKRGDLIKIAVMRKTSSGGRIRKAYFSWTNRGIYECSRRMIVPDPWDNMKDTFHEGDIVEVQCTNKTDGHFHGTLNGISDLRVYGKLFRGGTKKLKWNDIIIGCKYQCYIYKIDYERRNISVSAFKMLTDEPET